MSPKLSASLGIATLAVCSWASAQGLSGYTILSPLPQQPPEAQSSYGSDIIGYDRQNHRLLFWRQLINGAWVPLLRVEPVRSPDMPSPGAVSGDPVRTGAVNPPFICGTRFTVIQDYREYHNVRLHAMGDNSAANQFCADLDAPGTFVFDQQRSPTQVYYDPEPNPNQTFDDKRAFTILYRESTFTYFRMDIPALGAQP
jgi:hypothetical protein